MPFFTHRKRAHVRCERSRMDFKITIKAIHFKSNHYFLVNSHYVIYRKQNKKKKFKTKSTSVKVEDLKNVPVNETIKFRACLMQDLTHRYLEKYKDKNKKFILRQVTEVPGEELYVNVGEIVLPLHLYATKPSGQHLTVEFFDPKKKASGTVDIIVEHEPRVLIENMPNISEIVGRLFKKKKVKTPLPPSVLATNQDKLDFLKSKKQDHHRSAKYDDSDDESGDQDTRSESDNSACGQDGSRRAFNESFIITSHALSNREEIVDLEDHMFVLEESSPERQNSNSFKTPLNDTPRSTESVSTITVSAKDCASPMAAHYSYRPAMSDVPEEDSAVGSRNHVPFSSSSGSVSASGAREVAEPAAVDEEWEQPPADWLMTPATPKEASTLKVPPPIITNSKVLRMQRHGSDQIQYEQEQQQLKRASEANAAPRPLQPPVLKPKLSAKDILSMASEDDRDIVRPPPPNMPVQAASRPPGRTIKVPVRLSSTNDVNRMVVPPLPMPPAQSHTYHRAQSTPELTHSVSVKELRRNFERPPLHKDVSGSSSSVNSSNNSEDSNPRAPAHSGSNPPPRREMARSDSDRSYSTISTHEYIPKQPVTGGGVGGKIVVPVRLKSPEEEARYTGISTGLQSHNFHRTATAPAMHTSPARMTPPPSRNVDVSRPSYMSPPLISEKSSSGFCQSGATGQPAHPLHRTTTAPALGTNQYVREVQAAAYGSRGMETKPAAPVPPVAGLARGQSSRVMAPPIRLQNNEKIPEGYQRFIHIPGEVHHRHHHTETREQYHGEALRERAYGSSASKGQAYAR